MEKKITITLDEKDLSNFLRLIYAVERQVSWSSISALRNLSLHLAYDKEQLGKDIDSAVHVADELRRASREDESYDRVHLEGWC